MGCSHNVIHQRLKKGSGDPISTIKGFGTTGPRFLKKT
jgi:hypothetical protein